MSARRPVVLVVERSTVVRDRIGGWLEGGGYEVLACSGPRGPDYRCVGASRSGCPLVHGADAIVLDLWLESDAALEGIPAVELLGYYLSTGMPVLAFAHRDDPNRLVRLGRLATLPWPPDRRETLETIGALLRAD
jgi:CheY-like chemotaxis protein